MSSFITLPIMSLLLLAGCFVFIRIIVGPTAPDRLTALDLLSSIGIGIIAVYAIVTDALVLLDVAIILALINFLGTVAFAYYLEEQAE